ncbi:MAG: recombinase family protein [Sulfitobacter sp.]
MTAEQPKSVIYCRVSSRSQESEGHGLESQEVRCREYAKSKGYAVEAVFPDTITGGGDFMKRPGMVALLSYLDAMPDESYVVIFDDLKRFARDTEFHLKLRDAFRARNARIECLNFKFDDTPEGEFIETIMAAQGALERKQNGRQVAQKMKARMQSGYWIHTAPIGYKYETIKGRGKVLRPNEPLAGIIREAFEGYASGRFETHAEVKRFFENAPDFPRNRNNEVTFQRVTDILTHPIYTGHICSEIYGINWLKGQHEALIALETFDKVQARRTSAAKAPTRKDISQDLALRGFVACGDCNEPYTACWSTGKYKKYPYYLCDTKGCDSYRKSVPRAKIEGDFADIMQGLQPTKTLFELTRAMFKHAWELRSAQAETTLKSLQTQIRALNKQIEALLDRIVEASNPSVIRAYEGKIAKLERKKQVLGEKLQNNTAPRGKFEDFIELSLKFLSSPWKIWESGNITLRRTVLRLVFTERLAYCRNEGYRTPKTTLPFKALAELKQGKREVVHPRGFEPLTP